MLTDKQRSDLEAAAKSEGVDPADLIAEAEALTADAPDPGSAGKAKSAPSDTAAVKPNLYMYHLPFVTVNEVRTLWLDLDPVSGGDEYAGVWAAKQSGAAKPPATE